MACCEIPPKEGWTNGIHGASRLKFHPLEKANTIADCLEIQFTPHDLCDENHEWRVEAKSSSST
jgi:hypothetical protein